MSIKYHTSIHGSVKVYHLDGKLIDVVKSAEMMEKMNADIDAGLNKIVLDLENLDYINSNGLNIFLTVLRKIKATNGNICMCNANSSIIELLEITKLHTIFLNHTSLEKAIAHC
jgi:anti-anti-sigma factor